MAQRRSKSEAKRVETQTITKNDVGRLDAADLAQPTTNQEASATPTAEGASVQNLRLKGTNKSGKTASYGIPGVIGSIRVAKSAISNETFPATFGELTFRAVDEAKAKKMAEKAARREKSAETAQSRAAKLEARIKKAQEAAAKNQAKLEKVRARLQPKSAQEQTEANAAGEQTVVAEPGVQAEATEAAAQ